VSSGDASDFETRTGFLRCTTGCYRIKSDPLPRALLLFLPFAIVRHSCFRPNFDQGTLTMEWTIPQHEEICLSCEVGAYANAEL
jgi:hypothetical protein